MKSLSLLFAMLLTVSFIFLQSFDLISRYCRYEVVCGFSGRVPGVYDDWDTCNAQVVRFSGSCYKSFKTKDEAVPAYKKHLARLKGAEQDTGAVQFHAIEHNHSGCGFMFMAIVVVLVVATFAKFLL